MDFLRFVALCLFLLLSEGQGQSGDCPDYAFGERCKFRCNCEDKTEVCQQTTGFCHSGCPWGYIGISCLTQLPLLTSVPTSPWQSKFSMGIRFKQWEPGMGGDGPVVEYMVQHRRAEDTNWIETVSTIHTANGEEGEVTLGGLHADTRYVFRLIPVRDPNDFSRPGPEGWATTKSNITDTQTPGVSPCAEAENKVQLFIIICGVLGGLLFLVLIALIVVSVLFGLHRRNCDQYNNSSSSNNLINSNSNSNTHTRLGFSNSKDNSYSTSIPGPAIPSTPTPAPTPPPTSSMIKSSSNSSISSFGFRPKAKIPVEKTPSSENSRGRLSPIMQAGARFGVLLRSQGDGYEMPTSVPDEPVYTDAAYTSLGPH